MRPHLHSLPQQLNIGIADPLYLWFLGLFILCNKLATERSKVVCLLEKIKSKQGIYCYVLLEINKFTELKDSPWGGIVFKTTHHLNLTALSPRVLVAPESSTCLILVTYTVKPAKQVKTWRKMEEWRKNLKETKDLLKKMLCKLYCILGHSQSMSHLRLCCHSWQWLMSCGVITAVLPNTGGNQMAHWDTTL